MAQWNATGGARTWILGGLRKDQQVHPLEDNLRADVHRELAAFLQAKRDEATQIDQQFVAAVDSLSDFVLGPGKRLRPIFGSTAMDVDGGGVVWPGCPVGWGARA